jgi:hypothetical protein
MNEDELKLNEKTVNELQKSREICRKGKMHSLEKNKKEMNRK